MKNDAVRAENDVKDRRQKLDLKIDASVPRDRASGCLEKGLEK